MTARHTEITRIPPRTMRDREVLMQKMPFLLVKILQLSKVVPRKAAPGPANPLSGSDNPPNRRFHF